MTTPRDGLNGLDRLIHEPARLAILTVLSSAKSADFVFLQRITALGRRAVQSHWDRLDRLRTASVTHR